MCKLRIKSKFYNMTLLSVYAPAEDSNGEEIEKFYSDLSNICDKVLTHDALITLGDFNARIGKELANRGVAGKYTLCDQTHDRGERLIQLAQTRNLEVSGTKFPHKEMHKGSWKVPGEQHSKQIDHVLISERRASSVMDVKTFRGPNYDSDCYLLRVKIRQWINLTKKG
jgi:endonuclease/exonuclease/phosphatase family metal-dependent hydrolase